MEKKYIAPSIKVRQIVENENILAASGTLEPGEGGTEQQGGVDPNTGDTKDGGEALGKGNAWTTWDEEE